LPFGLGVARGERLEDVNFPGNVEIMDLVADAGFRHRPGRRGKGAGDAEHRRNIPERLVDAGRGSKIERRPLRPSGLASAMTFS